MSDIIEYCTLEQYPFYVFENKWWWGYYSFPTRKNKKKENMYSSRKVVLQMLKKYAMSWNWNLKPKIWIMLSIFST